MLLAASFWLFGTLASAQEAHRSSTASELLDHVIVQARGGNLERAWSAYVAFLRSPNDSRSLIRANNCDRENGPCPRLGRLGALLQKNRAEIVQPAESFCARGDAADAACMNWVAAELSLLWDDSVLSDGSLRSPSSDDWTVVPLGWIGDYNRENANELRPATDLGVHGQPLRAMIDNGSVLTKLTADDASAFHVVNATAVRQVRGIANRLVVRSPLRLGDLVHFVDATLDTTRGRQDVGNANIVGMNLLIQHTAVCFSWYESMLYLGRLGPAPTARSPMNRDLLHRSCRSSASGRLATKNATTRSSTLVPTRRIAVPRYTELPPATPLHSEGIHPCPCCANPSCRTHLGTCRSRPLSETKPCSAFAPSVGRELPSSSISFLRWTTKFLRVGDRESSNTSFR